MADSETVDVNTDNLEDFSKLLFGSAKPAEAAEPEAEAETEVEEDSETPSATEEVEESPASDEAEDQEDAPADDEDEEHEEEEKPRRGRKPARERINELTARARDAERRVESLIRELEARQEAKQPVQPANSPQDAGVPNPDEVLADGTLKYPLGEFDPTYIRDFTRHTIKNETEAVKVQMEEERRVHEAESAEREILAAWTDKLASAKERLPDLAEKAIELEETFRDVEPKYGQYLASTIMSLEFGPEVLDYLADHPEEARSIVNSGATRATIALGRIDGRFVKGEEVEKGTVVQTKAPPPPPKNKGSAGKVVVSADTDDLDAFERQFFNK